jgi:hypothetical protein
VLVHTAWSELSTRRISLPVARHLVVLHRFSSLLLMRILQLDDLMALTTVRLLRILNTLVALDQVLLLTVK